MGGIAVKRGADFEEVPDCFFRIFVIEERSVGIPGGSLEDFGRAGDKPHDVAEFPEKLAVFGPADDSAAGGDDVPGVSIERLKEFGLHVAEGLFTLFLKDLRDGPPILLHDEVVGVNERVAEGLGEISSDGGLSRSHKSDEDNVLLHAPGKTLPF